MGRLARPGEGGRHCCCRVIPWPGRVAATCKGGPPRPAGDPGETVPTAARWQNGWGFVLYLDGQVFYDFGVIKPEHLAPFTARQAFIYVVGIMAQVLPLVDFARGLHPYWIAFIDNVAEQNSPYAEGLWQGPGGQRDAGLLRGLAAELLTVFRRPTSTSRTLCLGAATTPGHGPRAGRRYERPSMR